MTEWIVVGPYDARSGAYGPCEAIELWQGPHKRAAAMYGHSRGPEPVIQAAAPWLLENRDALSRIAAARDAESAARRLATLFGAKRKKSPGPIDSE